MRRFQIFSTLALTLCAGVVACDGGDDGGTDDVADADTTSSTDPTGSEAETDTSGNTDNTGGCFEQPAECAQLIECFAEILPDQDMSQFAADGSCWCGSTQEEALECYNICKDQIEAAVEQYPTLGACHGRYCPLEELDAAQPYGPPPCTGDAMELQGLPVDGTYCAPPCGGFAKDCPEHSQTIAEGTCYWNGGDNGFCALWCYVDPYIYASGTQCQCGATCQPYGGADGSGNQRGVCTFE